MRTYRRGIAAFFLLIFLQETFAPTMTFALTGGPSQPEVESFEPVGTNQMVDLSTGDFNYNIPLMVVPGPNGGYPINLAYHAGIGMEQEASWVGLGWNINPGAITRNMRGVPDDFNGDIITKTVNMKTDVTVGVGVNLAALIPGPYNEVFGYQDELTGDIQLYYNNYRGIGYNISSSPISATVAFCQVDDMASNGITGSLSFSYDSQSGLGLSPAFGIGKYAKDNEGNWSGRSSFSVGIGMNTRQGMQDLRFDFGRSKNDGKLSRVRNFGNSYLGAINFAAHTYVPATNTSMSGWNVNAALTIKKPVPAGLFDKDKEIKAQVITNSIDRPERLMNAYGTLYLENQEAFDNAGTDYDRIVDVNVNNSTPISKNSVHMGVPVMTNDVYIISGQGVGGSFRAHRNDIGRLYNPGNTSYNKTVNGAGEGGKLTIPPSSYEVHVGVDAGIGYHKSYSGKWDDGMDQLEYLSFTGKNVLVPGYEPFYFKVAGEQTASRLNEWVYMAGERPVAFDLGLKWQGVSPVPIVKSNLAGSSFNIQQRGGNAERVKRIQNIQYRSKTELTKDDDYDARAYHLYDVGVFPDGSSTGNQIAYTTMPTATVLDGQSHLHEYVVVSPDGAKYVYGLPAYNTEHKERVFANVNGVSAFEDEDLVAYDAADASVNNDEGTDHYFSETDIPPYVHANLITQITSADYVDVTGNGPSEDDFGFYTKFNYTKVSDYEWREPFYDANYIKGYYSNEADDKAAYTYGKKDLYYVQSIETKTHVAMFYLGDRRDGKGVSDIDQTSSTELGDGESQKYLQKIVLYSKNDPNYGNQSLMVPLQTVFFQYSYELCPGIYNNDDGATDNTDHIIAGGTGKLTLKKVFIMYNGNEKGRLSPYEFDYDNENQTYNKLNVDRWGNYQEALNTNENGVNPYTRHDISESDHNSNASAWCLNKITLPSGGEINIGYEADTYGYVQDKRAMQMCEILGFTETNTTTPPIGDSERLRLSKHNLRLWFKMDESMADGTEKLAMVADYVAGIEEVYFKVYEDLKVTADLSAIAKDYVSGYAKLDIGEYGTSSSTDAYGYVDLEEVSYKTAGLDLFHTHPFRKAGWQYVRYQRPDLFYNQADADNTLGEDVVDNLIGIAVSLGSAVSDAISVVTMGYYNKAALLGYCKTMNIGKRSFVRLNCPGRLKYGGGHRVGTLIVKDNWVEGSREFGTEYSYKTTSGQTSGVADYEPLVGGEENCLKQPLWYNGNDQLLNFNHIDAYLETPLNEAVYPGPRVVYGRVVQKNMYNEDVTESQSGITVNEFYTARDFPVYEQETELETKGFNLPVYVPFVGLQTYQNNGYSQGYTVVLNDMSGRPKKVATYPYRNGNVSGQPISAIEYFYKTTGPGRLDNKVTVLDHHGVSREAILGVEQDFMIFEEQNNNVTYSGEAETNVEVIAFTIPAPVPIPVVVPIPTLDASFNYAESMYRGITTNKIIYKTGILNEVRAYSDGSLVTTKNLLFDAETGEPVLTKVNNEWDKPVFSYSHPAHWYYDGMAGAYKNYRDYVKVADAGGTGNFKIVATLPGPTTITLQPEVYLEPGDEIQFLISGEYVTYYVTVIDDINDKFVLENAAGTLVGTGVINNATGTIMRSGHRNQQAQKCGSIISLNTDFLTMTSSDYSQQFALFNAVITGGDPQMGEDDPSYIDLDNMTEEEYVWNANNYVVPNFYFCDGESIEGAYREMNVEGVAFPDNPEDVEEVTDMAIRFGIDGCRFDLRFENEAGDDTPWELGYIYPVNTGELTPSYSEQLVNFKIVSETLTMDGITESVELMFIPTGEIFTANWYYPNTTTPYDEGDGPYCFNSCLVEGVLHSDAVVYSDEWGATTPYTDLGEPGGITNTSTENEYASGKLGIWRPQKTFLFQMGRHQTGTASTFLTKIDQDGVYNEWTPFNWTEGAPNPNWDWVSEITRYSPYGFALEELSRLSTDLENGGTPITLYNSQLYAFNNSLVIATSGNASYFEIGYDGFEENISTPGYVQRGHIALNMVGGGSIATSSTKAHTGSRSIVMTNAQSFNFVCNEESAAQELQGIAGKEYLVSMWVNVSSSSTAKGALSDGTNTVETDDSGEMIDGWKKLELKFTMPPSGDVTLTYTSTGTTYVDDIRFGPYNGGMMTYVFDPHRLWLLAELDVLNYATFYNYDSEGKLVQVKKETERGIITIQTSRSNIKQ